MTVSEFTSKFNGTITEFNLYYKDKELIGPLCEYADNEVLYVRDSCIKVRPEEDIFDNHPFLYPVRKALVLYIEIGDKKEDK